jgi:regulator of protease activity HflC (stomatin/prohibitin superfamily)
MSDAITDEPTRGIGDNAPPLVELLAEEAAPLAARRDELLGSVSRVPAAIIDEPMSEKVADLIRLINACRAMAVSGHKIRKQPFLDGGRLVDAAYHKITEPLEAAKKAVETKLTLWQRQKAENERRAREAEARRQAEEAERQRREAEEAAQAAQTEADLDEAISAEEIARQAAADAARAQRHTEAPAAELSRTRGDLGAVASLHTFTDFKDLDRAKIDLNTLRPHLALDCIEKAVRAYIRAGGRELTGCVIFENTSTRVR